MSAQEQMARLLQNWLQLTRAESAAIQAGAWPRLQTIQSEKTRLREPLNDLKKACLGAGREASSAASLLKDDGFRAAIGRLIALEEHNAQLVAARRQKAREQQLHLSRASRNLRQLKKSYASQLPTAMHSWV
jgi:hypothetical protein